MSLARKRPAASRQKLEASARAEEAPPVDPKFSAIVKALTKERGVTCGGKGFGSSALKTAGKIFAMTASKGQFVVKLSKARVDELVAGGVGQRFEPGTGRLMKEWLAVSAPPKQWLALAKEALLFARGERGIAASRGRVDPKLELPPSVAAVEQAADEAREHGQ